MERAKDAISWRLRQGQSVSETFLTDLVLGLGWELRSREMPGDEIIVTVLAEGRPFCARSKDYYEALREVVMRSLGIEESPAYV